MNSYNDKKHFHYRWPSPSEAAGVRGIPATPEIVCEVDQAPIRSKLGRNDPCWCGSGKKYKLCHLDDDLTAN